MKNGVVRRVLALLVLSIAAPQASAEIILRTAAGPHAPPRYNIVEQGGKKVITGLCIDIMRAIEKVDPEIRFVGDQNSIPAARVLAMLEGDELDVSFCLSKTAEREMNFRIINPPLYEINQKLAVRANDQIDIRSFDDIRKLGGEGIILVNFGTATVQYLEGVGGLRIDSAGKTQNDNLRKLIAGAGRFYYRHDLGLEGEIKAGGFSKEVRILPVVLNKDAQYAIFSKSANPMAIERVRKALEKLKASGKLAKLRANY